MSQCVLYNKLPDEPQDAYKAFCYYRDLPPYDRVIDRARAKFGPNVGGWFATYNWPKRADAWDIYCAQKRSEEKRRWYNRVEDETMGGIEDASLFCRENMERFARILLGEDLDSDEKPIISYKEAYNILVDAIVKARLIVGQSTENIKSEETLTYNLEKLTDEELLDISEKMRKARS